MKQKELLVLSIAIFMTILAMVLGDIYKAKNNSIIEKEIPPVQAPKLNINVKTFDTLKMMQE